MKFLRQPVLFTLGFLLCSAMTLHAQPAATPTPPAKLASAVFRYEDLTAKPSGVGERRDVARNPTVTLDEFECHLSTLNPGQPSHPPHRHPQEELIVLSEGTLEVFINGKTERVGPGSLFFFASYDLHAVKNVGTTPAKYSVFNFTTTATRALEPKPAAESASPDKLRSSVFNWEKLTVEKTKSGERRAVFDSPTVTCTNLECHVTTLKAGEIPHVGHRHPDDELILVKEGTMEATINGRAQSAGPGSIFFFSSNDEHAMKNVGATTATYYVIRIVTAATPKKSGA